MTDAPFVAAAYAIVLGGLAGYVLTIKRRTRAALRAAAAIDRQRRRDPDASDPEPAVGTRAWPPEHDR